MLFRILLRSLGTALILLATAPAPAKGALEFADTITGFFAGPYSVTKGSGVVVFSQFFGGTSPGIPDTDFPIVVPLSHGLGSETGGTVQFLSIPDNSFVIVQFAGKVIVNIPGPDIAIREVGNNGEIGLVSLSEDGVNFSSPLAITVGSEFSTFNLDLASFGFASVKSIRIEGTDLVGASPGFDLVSVQANVELLQTLNGEAPEPASFALWSLGILGTALGFRRKRRPIPAT